MELDLEFTVTTPIGLVVRCSRTYWILISESKHPVMKGHRDDVIQTLTQPDEIRRSRKDESVLLFYRGTAPRWICAVTKNVDGHDGYLITAYPTDRVKIGDVIWKK